MIARRIRFGVLRGGALGDFLVTLPALTAIRAHWPDAFVECVGYPHIAQLAQAAGLLDQVTSLDQAQMARFFSTQPTFTAQQVDWVRSFDLIFTYLHDRNGVVRENLELAGARQVIYGSPLIPSGIHAADHLVEPLESLAIYVSQAEPHLPIPVTALPARRGADRPDLAAEKYWIVHPGSGSPAKNWPPDHYFALAQRLESTGQGTVLFLFGEADCAVRDALSRLAPDRVLEGLSLLEVVAWLKQARGFIGNDSGITHLAAALGTRTWALFGPTDPHQWGPRGKQVRIVSAPERNLQALLPSTVYTAIRDTI